MSFIDNIKKVKGPRKHKIKNSYGLYDAYKYYRKHKPKESKYIITSAVYSSVIKNINSLIIDKLLDEGIITFPKRMGLLYLLKNNTKIYEKDGKIINTYPIDWNTTLKLWEGDAESFNKRLLVKRKTNWVYKVKYDVSKANYKYKSVFSFQASRNLKLRLKNEINNHNIDAYIKQNYE